MEIVQTSLFEEAPPAHRRPVEPIVRTALVQGNCRFWLKRAWGAGPNVCWAMVNPSVADGAGDDPTMWRVMEFSLRQGFGSCTVVNIYPIISPYPAAIRAWRGRGQFPTGEGWTDNLDHCARELSAAQLCVAAWGNNADPQDVATWLEVIAWRRVALTGASPESVMDVGLPVKWVCLGTTTSGAPKHPLARGKHRVPPDFKPVPWTL